MEEIAYELNCEGARLAREAATWRAAARTAGRASSPARSARPTAPRRSRRTSPIPGFRAVTFDELRDAYGEQVRGLIDGGADLLLIETIFDTLNAKAAIYAIAESCEARGVDVPVMISGTITDRSGRTLSGQTPEAFWNSVRHAKPVVDRPELRARRRGDARAYRRAVARRRHARLRLSERRPAERVRPLRREPGGHGAACSANSPRPASSTSSAAAAAPRRSTSAPSPRRWRARRRARSRRPRRCCGCPASSRSRSRRKFRSSTSASAPTSPARPSSAS